MEEINITEKGKEALLTLLDEIDEIEHYINNEKFYDTIINIRTRLDAVLFHPSWDLSDFTHLIDIINEK